MNIDQLHLRVMSAEEASRVAVAWDLSPECARLAERQRKVKQKIEEKSASYSSRC